MKNSNFKINVTKGTPDQYYDSFLNAIEDGKIGRNNGLPMGFKRLSYLLNGIQRKRYDLVFGAEGTGKTAFVMNTYVLNPFNYVYSSGVNVDLKILWFSLEVDAVSVLTKLHAWKLYNEYSILVDSNIILSKGANKIPEHIEAKVKNQKDYFDKLRDCVTIIDAPMTPSQIKETVMDFAKSRGYFKKDERGLLTYVPYNTNEHVIIITDTLGNLKVENVDGRYDKKGTIDYHSANSAHIYRNMLGYTVCNVAHSNRKVSDVNRARFAEIFPNKDDIKDSSQPSADANTVLTIFNPEDYRNSNNNLSRFMNYKIDLIGNRFRAIGVLKNREGDNNKRVGMMFLGENGYFQELPRSTDITDQDYDAITSLKKVDVFNND